MLFLFQSKKSSPSVCVKPFWLKPVFAFTGQELCSEHEVEPVPVGRQRLVLVSQGAHVRESGEGRLEDDGGPDDCSRITAASFVLLDEVESRRHRRSRIDCRSETSQTRCRGLERRCTIAIGKTGSASAWDTHRATRVRGVLLGEEIFRT